MKRKEKQMQIANKIVSPNNPPFIIAEMSGNHNQSLDRALELVKVAAQCGADAVKLQTYTADTMTIDIKKDEFFIDDEKSLWNGHSLYQLYEKAHTPWDWHKPIFDYAKELGIIAFSTPFDNTAVDFLEELNVPCYKIASFEIIDLPLIKKVASTGKPIIMSTGMASLEEISEAIETARNSGAKDIILLKCTSAYPARYEDANLASMQNMQKKFNVQIGLSDHTMGTTVPIAATILGATVIEKHFTLDRADGGVDSAFSLEPNELENLVKETKNAFYSIGEIKYSGSNNEQKNKIFRRSIYVVEDVKKGEEFTYKNIRIIRPGYGLKPKFFDEVIGKKAKKDIKKGTAVDRDLYIVN